jgi:hypothetical protein
MRFDMHIGAAVCALFFALAVPADAATYKWVDENGHVQYGDRIPEKYRNKASEEMNRRGVVTKKIEGQLTPEQQKAKDDEAARLRAEKQRAVEQQRMDNALLATYTNDKEIDLKRDRELQAAQNAQDTLKTSLRLVSDRIDELRKGTESPAPKKKAGADPKKAKKAETGPSPEQTEEIAKAQTEKEKLEKMIADKDKDMNAIRSKYEADKKRFVELRRDQTTKR